MLVSIMGGLLQATIPAEGYLGESIFTERSSQAMRQTQKLYLLHETAHTIDFRNTLSASFIQSARKILPVMIQTDILKPIQPVYDYQATNFYCLGVFCRLFYQHSFL